MTKANILAIEELIMVREFIFLPMLLTIVEKNKCEIDYSSNPLRHLYLASIETLMNRIHSDLTAVRKELRQRNIKVIEDDWDESKLRYVVYYRRYEEKFSMMKQLVKSELSIKLGNYVGQLIKQLENH